MLAVTVAGVVQVKLYQQIERVSLFSSKNINIDLLLTQKKIHTFLGLMHLEMLFFFFAVVNISYPVHIYICDNRLRSLKF